MQINSFDCLCKWIMCWSFLKISDKDICFTANIEVSPDKSDPTAAQEETETVFSKHSDDDGDGDGVPEPPSKIFRPVQPVSPPELKIEDSRTMLDVDGVLTLKSNVCCKSN
ncbi:hypothetical protein EB796_016513 [Bugula neritina]|uniref:Uncharacterized protein n=1 Tax=Bugula neritina TaxID=10212 RepID=A0A7J7JFW2_BUGNE|nr:hypothetical protein EB796_016513 [Bugula neritina]